MESRKKKDVSSREKVLAAAAAMMAESPTTRLTVRAVAARAGVSVGSLQFHFPTQRALQDALLERVYDHLMPDDPIRDLTLSARDRLVACLRQVLAPAGVGDKAREAWSNAWEMFIEPEQTDDVRSAYAALERENLRRITYWLATLAKDGALPSGNHTQRAKFLMTVLNGLSIERALPTGESVLLAETSTLYLAVDAVLGVPVSTEAHNNQLHAGGPEG
ncbi:TetR/AcrR family transcriptional regulator [Nesterenkonia halotolerans]|uniref:TetR/AcrR family transcriptional regulator n=1 Tax=Nesterenkonia halotolerans TaxID=225325 RepID=UPI003EE679C4